MKSRRPKSPSAGSSTKTCTSTCRRSRWRTRRRASRSSINPLVNWIWLGFAVMALGTGIVLLPERTFAFAMAKFPAPEVATTAGMFLLMLSSRRACAGAAHRERRRACRSRSTRRSSASCSATSSACAAPAGGRISLSAPAARPPRCAPSSRGWSKQGKTREDVIQYYVAKYGSQEPLAAPIDKGFNRLAWFFPYAVGGFAAIARGVRRQKMVAPLARRAAGAATGRGSAEDAAMQARLDRELENLD